MTPPPRDSLEERANKSWFAEEIDSEISPEEFAIIFARAELQALRKQVAEQDERACADCLCYRFVLDLIEGRLNDPLRETTKAY